MEKILDIAFSGFWPFVGVVILTGMIVNGIFNGTTNIVRIINRRANIRQHGWPPPHIDADGDWRPLPKEKRKGDGGFTGS